MSDDETLSQYINSAVQLINQKAANSVRLPMPAESRIESVSYLSADGELKTRTDSGGLFLEGLEWMQNNSPKK